MKAALFITFLLCSDMVTGYLDQFKWKKRILLVFESPTKEATAEFEALIKENEGELEERDLIIFIVRSSNIDTYLTTQILDVSPSKIRVDFGVSLTEQSVVLIGKDGTVKLRETLPTSLDKIFDTIDQMPMRQEEMGD